MVRAIHPSRQAYVEDDQDDGSVDLASIPTDTNYAIPSTASGLPSEQTAAILNEFARKRKAASLAVPTDDTQVRQELRARGEPITLFGERREDRRDRLREILFREHEAAIERDVEMGNSEEEPEEEQEEEFYTEGVREVLDARRYIARFSLPRAQQRIAYQTVESRIPVATHVKHRLAIKDRLSGYELFGSQIASQRPVAIVRFAPNGELIASGDWGGSVKLIDVPSLETRSVLRGHKGMVGGLSWYPEATLPTSKVTPESVNLASSGSDGDVNLWSLTQDTPISTLRGHSARVCRTEFHPSGKYLASASYDHTWRLWDVTTTQELLFQEGHSKEVYSVSFNEDGSLLASGGLDSIGRIWDLRTGRTAMLLEGHIAPIYALDWGCDGVRVMSGSADGFAKCWDVRAVRETASVGAHVGGVSDLRWFKGTDGPLSGKKSQPDVVTENGNGDNESEEEFQPKKSGTFVISCGFDKAVNIFSADDWALCKSLTGHDGTVLAADATSDAKWVASCSRDRTIKLWSRDDMTAL